MAEMVYTHWITNPVPLRIAGSSPATIVIFLIFGIKKIYPNISKLILLHG